MGDKFDNIVVSDWFYFIFMGVKFDNIVVGVKFDNIVVGVKFDNIIVGVKGVDHSKKSVSKFYLNTFY